MTLTPEFRALFDGWKERIEALAREHPLQIISWEATRRCNLRCVHCGSPSEEVDLSQELTTDEIVGAFDQIANDFDMGQFRHINITGGEPFVRKDLMEVLSRISKWPYFRNIDIQTNGIYIADHPEVLKELKKVGVTGLGISIDGLEQSHDAFRRKKGSWKKAMAAAKMAVGEGYVVTVSMVAHAKNIDQIEPLYKQVKKEIKPRVFRVMTIDPLGRAALDKKYLLAPKQVREVIDFLKREYTKGCAKYSDQKHTMVELGCCGWVGAELEGTIRPFIFHCIAGLNNLGILYDGKLGSCSNIPRELVEGDLRRTGIKNVWDMKYQRYRNLPLRKKKICDNCDQLALCHGGPMHKYYIDDSPGCIYRNIEEVNNVG